MNDSDYNRLIELSWRRRLTEAESAELRDYLAAHPEARDDWESEAQLNQFLEKLPDAPAVSSNFTALVMQAVERENASRARGPFAASRRLWRYFPVWTRGAATACVVIGIGWSAYHAQQVHAREQMAGRVAGLADVFSASGPEAIVYFDPINRLSDMPPTADFELIASMK